MGLADLYLENTDGSILKLEKAQELINSSLSTKESSEAWGLLAESGSYIMLQKGISYIISNSPKVKEYGEKAIALNPNNYRAIVIDAQGLINAPRIFGGDKKRGLENLRKLTEKPMEKQDKFFVLMALSQSLVQDKKTLDEGIKYAKEALKLYPLNIEALKIIN
jgi:tetratricopeptide (TPR) repeat protein